jgi:hypothetical protein
MIGAFDAINSLIDVPALEQVHLLQIGTGRVGYEFLRLAVHHGIRQVCIIEHDYISPRNFASGFPEAAVGQLKPEYVRRDLKRRRKDIAIYVRRTALVEDHIPWFSELLNWATHVVFAIDDFPIVSRLVSVAYSLRPCLYAALLDNGRVGESAWSLAGQTPCLNCSARLPEKQGANGGQTLLVDVSSVVNVAFRQFIGLCLIGKKGFELFAPLLNPRFCLAYVINEPGGFVSMPRPDTPCGVRLVQVVDEHGRGPSCRTCQGYRP